jgi:hypothetical protein
VHLTPDEIDVRPSDREQLALAHPCGSEEGDGVGDLLVAVRGEGQRRPQLVRRRGDRLDAGRSWPCCVLRRIAMDETALARQLERLRQDGRAPAHPRGAQTACPHRAIQLLDLLPREPSEPNITKRPAVG